MRPALALALLTCMALASPGTAATVRESYPLLTSGPLAAARLADLPGGLLLRAGAVQITEKQLAAKLAGAPPQQRSQLQKHRFFLLEQMAIRSLLGEEARAWGKSQRRPPGEEEEALIRAFLQSRAAGVAVSAAEVREFHRQNRDLVGGLPLEQVQEELKSYLLNEKRQQAVQRHLNTLGERTPIQVATTWVKAQYALATDNPVDRARLSGKPTLADFGASGCRPCEMMAPILESLRKQYQGRANVVFVHVGEEPVLAARYQVSSIPVQVFFDRQGKEVFRHVGFFPEQQMKAKLAELGVK